MENEQARLCRQVADLQSENSKLRRELEAAQQSCAMSALRQSEEKFRLAFQTSPDSINFNRLADGVYLDINEGFTKLTGYTRADAIGKSSVDLGIWCESRGAGALGQRPSRAPDMSRISRRVSAGRAGRSGSA